LESRVLLSTTSISKLLEIAPRELPRSPVVVVPLVEHKTSERSVVASVRGPANLTPSMTIIIPPQDAVDIPGGGALPLQAAPVSIAMRGTSATMPGMDGIFGPTLVVSSLSATTLNEGAVPPVIVVDQAALKSAAGRGGSSAPLTWTSWPLGMPPVTVEATTIALPPTPKTGAEISLSGIPDEPHVQVDTSLNSPYNLMSLSIPVGPATEAVGVSLHAMLSDGVGDLPVVKAMVLEDRDGDPVAQLGPFVGPQATPSLRALTVSLENAPVGGSLLVQVSLPAQTQSSTATGSVGTSPQGAGSALPFMMDIQRQDAAPAASPDPESALLGSPYLQVPAGINPLSSTSPSGRDQGASTAADPSGSDGEPQAQATIADQENAIPPAEAPADSGENRSGSLELGVGTGPLVSRSSSPLGPILATLIADPAPPVDRHERALFQVIEESESDAADKARLQRSDDNAQEVGTELAREATSDGRFSEETLVASAGLGAFPLKVTGTDLEDQTSDLASIVVALPRTRGEIGDPSVVVANDPRASDETTATAPAGVTDRSGRIVPIYLTTAFGLALGVSLTAKPHLPDLLALVPSRFLSRSRRPADASRPANGSRPR
jgi:hypothetical protein